MVESVDMQGAGRAGTAAAPQTRRPPAAVWTVAAAVTAVCWALTVRDVDHMAGGMPMPGGWTMSMTWMAMPGQSVGAAALMFLAMWQVMMIAMMLPSAMPIVLLYRGLVAGRHARGESAPPSVVLLAGYFFVWLLFGAVAFAAGFGISALAMREEAVSGAIPAATGFALIAAGAYQLTPLRRMCLRHCRSPLSFFTTGWRPGWIGTFRLGLHHGAYCAGCCWALMLIQLALGVMSLPLMIALAAVIAMEKMWRHGEHVARVVGVLALAAGLVTTAAALAAR